MARDAVRAADNSLGQLPPAPLTLPLTSRNLGATIRRHSVLPRLAGIHVLTIAETQACHSARPGRASNACLLPVRADGGKRVSSVAPLAIRRRIHVPALLQRLANLRLGKSLLLRKILSGVMGLPVLRHEFGRFHIIRFPIEIENLIFGPQKIL